jgi:hypothetical protein
LLLCHSVLAALGGTKDAKECSDFGKAKRTDCSPASSKFENIKTRADCVRSLTTMNKWMKRRIERSRARCRRADVVKREESKVDPKGQDSKQKSAKEKDTPLDYVLG